MTEAYALFAWECHEQQGGVGDLRAMGSLVECTQAFAVLHDRLRGDCDGEIVDLATMTVAFRPDPNTPGAPCFIDWVQA